MAAKDFLIAFDFDHTIVDENSDITIRALLNKDKLTSKLQSMYKSDGWTAYMQEIFNLLHEQGVTQEVMKKEIKRIPPTMKMLPLLRELRNLNCDCIIISDANSYFIREWLIFHKAEHVFTEVFTNPAEFVEGRLVIEKYHEQDWCNLSTNNLCKGHILEEFIQQQKDNGVSYKSIAYVGDGKNDFCPSLRLSEGDVVFPRNGFPLKDILKANKSKVKAFVNAWSSADEILSVIKDKLCSPPNP